LLAHHWEQSGDRAQAARWHRRAGEWVGARDPLEGMRHWRKVRDLGRSLELADIKEARLLACRNILASGTWRFGIGEEETRDLLGEGRALAQELGRPAAIAAMLVGVAARIGVLGRAEAALETALDAFAMISPDMELGEVVAIETGRAYWSLMAGRLPQAQAAFEHIVELSGGDPHVGREVIGYSPLMWAELTLSEALAMIGRFDECWPHAERALRMAREHRAQENQGWALGGIAINAYLARGTTGVPVTDLRQACVQGVEIAEAGGSRFSQILAAASLATAHFLNGDYGPSEDLFGETLALARSAGTALDWQSYNLAVFADVALTRGDTEAAIARAREGVELADANGAWFHAATCRAVLADALVHAGASAQEISQVIKDARELVGKSGGRSLLPRLHEGEARVTGRTDRALLHAGLHEAESMYRAMGAPDPANRLIAEIGC
jgi:tetratricopeptide (TPR) repeat protein